MISQVGTLAFEDFEKSMRLVAPRRTFRLALAPGEVLRMDRARRHVRVLSGTAWITCSGRDVIVETNQEVELPKRGRCALVSALEGRPVFFEVW